MRRIPNWIKIWLLTSLLVTGIILLIFRTEAEDSGNSWFLSFLASAFIYTWGTIMWYMIERREKTVSVRYNKVENEDGEETVTINVDNASPEEAMEIYDHIKGLNI